MCYFAVMWVSRSVLVLGGYQACPWEWDSHGKCPMGWDGMGYYALHFPWDLWDSSHVIAF